MKKTIFLIGMLSALGIATYAPHRAAAFSPCDFQNALQNLSQKKQSYITDDSPDNLRAELDARKTILNQVLDCALRDARAMQSNIKSLRADDPDIQAIQDRLVSKFNDIIDYYQLQKTLVGDLGIEGSKKFSTGLKEWRNANYEPLSELGTNFVIFSKNQKLMQLAESRFDQIKRTLQALQLTDTETIRTLLQNAGNTFGKAKDDNERTRQIFERLSWPNDSSERIASSLEYLKETYQNFFDIRNEAQKITRPSS